MPLQARVQFPGVRQVVSFSLTYSHGITPSVATLDMAPQPSFPARGGTLLLSYGTTRIALPGCKVQKQSFRLNSQGQVVGLTLLDRRWKWQYGVIHGWYNTKATINSVSREDRTFDTFAAQERVRSARQLAVLCLAEMGEAGYDVSALPGDQYPEVDWQAENPAQALERLANLYGCRVVLRLDSTVLVAKVGVGAQLPAGSFLEDSRGVTPPEVPDAIRLVCGRTEFQADFLLTPVGLDCDGTIKPLDDLSYRPVQGWTDEDPYLFPGVVEERADGLRPRDLAKKTVWRWYQVYRTRLLQGEYAPGRNEYWVPGYGKIKYPEQFLPLSEYQTAPARFQPVVTPRPRLLGEPAQDLRIGPVANPVRADPQGNLYRLPAWLWGTFAKLDGSFENWAENKMIDDGWQLNADLGIVEFERPRFKLFRQAENPPLFGYEAAELFLRTSFGIRNLPTWAWDRCTIDVPLPGASWGTGPEILKHEEIALALEPEYGDARDGPLRRVKDNKARIGPVIDHYLRATLSKYQVTLPREAHYAGLLPISPDGAIQQVSWSVGISGATTRVGRNTEFSLTVPSYEQRRQAEEVRASRLAVLQQQVQDLRRGAQ